MTKKSINKKTRRRYAQGFREEALALADRVGVSQAAEQLGLHASQLYAWRAKAKTARDQSDCEQSLTMENARLKRQLAEQAEELAILKKAATYFAKCLK